MFDEHIDNQFLSITINLLEDKPCNINYFDDNIKQHSNIYFKEPIEQNVNG